MYSDTASNQSLDRNAVTHVLCELLVMSKGGMTLL